MTVIKRQLKHSHNTLPPYFLPPLLLQTFFLVSSFLSFLFFYLFILLLLVFHSTVLLFYNFYYLYPQVCFLLIKHLLKPSPEQPMSTHTSVTVTSTAHLSSFGFVLSSFGFVQMLKSDIHHSKSMEGVQHNYHNLQMSACLDKLTYHVQLTKYNLF